MCVCVCAGVLCVRNNDLAVPWAHACVVCIFVGTHSTSTVTVLFPYSSIAIIQGECDGRSRDRLVSQSVHGLRSLAHS